jgi:4-amino-4-deoxy-L-arabinose transferase-like glycosyltransferase
VTSTIQTDDHLPVEDPTARRIGTRTVWLIAAIIGLAGLVPRWLLLRSPAGVLTADEAYTGIQSYEILGGQFPIVLGGTAYTLPFEAYLYAPVAAVFGTNVVVLKMLSTLSWALASVAVYHVAKRASNRRTGLIAATLCWITPGGLLLISVTAYPAYASGLLVSVGAFALAAVATDADEPGRRLLLCFGSLAGFGFWLHPMFLASLVPMVLVVLWTHHRRIEVWVLVTAGGLLGCAPLLLWNAKNGWPSLESPTEVEGTYLERLRTFAEDLMPRALGLRNIELEWQPNNLVAPAIYLCLVALAIYGTVVSLRRSERRSRLLLPAVLLGVFPIMALFENLIFAFDGRYGIISFPFVVMAIAIAVDSLAGRTSVARTFGVFSVVAIVWVVGLIGPTVRPLVDASGGNPNGHLEDAVAALDDAGVDRVYGSYWAVMPIDYMGDKRIVGAVFPFWPIRFPDRQRTVEANSFDDIAIVFVNTDEDPSQLPMPVERYDRRTFGNIVIYFPVTRPSAD